MRSIALLVFSVLATASAASKALAPDHADPVAEATAVCIRALDFTQGDAASLVDARSRFTAEGWARFMKKLDGWLDSKGAANFSSRFLASGPALDVRRHDGMAELTLPGVLEQESRNAFGGVSTTRYRAEIDVQFAEATHLVTQLKQRTCGGAGSHASCR